MSDIKVTIERDGMTATYNGEFAVIGIIKTRGDEKVLSVATSGGTTAYGAAMLGCQVVAKLAEPFDTMEPVSPGSEV